MHFVPRRLASEGTRAEDLYAISQSAFWQGIYGLVRAEAPRPRPSALLGPERAAGFACGRPIAQTCELHVAIMMGVAHAVVA